jgi:hypothetical protein
VRVVGEDMLDVPRQGAVLGEVAMRGNNVMKEYFLQPEATSEAFRGGWFHSGDLGVCSPRRLHRAPGPKKGHHHFGRRECIDHRGGAGPRQAPGCVGVCGGCDSTRHLGRAALSLRDPETGGKGQRGGDH